MFLNHIFALFVPFCGHTKIAKKTHVEERATQIQVAIDEYDKIP